jgi:hypothetical protein
VKPANFMILVCVAVYVAVMPPTIVFMGLVFGVPLYYFWLSLIPLVLVVLLWVVALRMTRGSQKGPPPNSKGASGG